MSAYAIAIFIVAVGLGAWVQGATGFALGIVFMAIVQIAGVMSIADAAAVISVLALFNIAVGLVGATRKIDWPIFRGIAIGQFPAIVLGVWLLTILSANQTQLLGLLFGLFLLFSSAFIVVRPQPLPERSKTWTAYVAGFFGGIFGGMFSTAGPATGWYCYRQPLAISILRATLLAGFLAHALTRTALVGGTGFYDRELLLYIAIGLPVALVATWFARLYPPRISDLLARRLIFLLLAFVGLWRVIVIGIELLVGSA